jgi:uncharacterized protein YecE (DUF72 family)
MMNQMTVEDAAAKKIRVGCQSWGYDDWVTPAGGKLIFYPAGTKRSEMLAFYSKVFGTIEVDSTLYAIPPATTFEKWHDETPDDFIFSLKFPREVTHDRPLSPESIPVALEFVARTRLLKTKLGILLIQLPPSFEGSKENGRRLRALLAALPKDVRFAVEFRNREWFIDWTFEELERNGVTLGLVEGPWLPRELMFEAAAGLTADFAYIRIMGERDLERFDQIYRHRDDVLEKWGDMIRGLPARDIYVYIDNYFEGFAPETVAKLQRLLDLPVSQAGEYQLQGSLF